MFPEIFSGGYFMNGKNYYDGEDIPLGLSMAMAQNPLAYDYFAQLSPQQRQDIIDASRNVRSREEMKQFADILAHSEKPFSDSL
jgi:hypothetical protein